MTFTDLFVRRPVLALVVSTLILLVRRAGAQQVADPPIPAAGKLDHHHQH